MVRGLNRQTHLLRAEDPVYRKGTRTLKIRFPLPPGSGHWSFAWVVPPPACRHPGTVARMAPASGCSSWVGRETDGSGFEARGAPQEDHSRSELRIDAASPTIHAVGRSASPINQARAASAGDAVPTLRAPTCPRKVPRLEPRCARQPLGDAVPTLRGRADVGSRTPEHQSVPPSARALVRCAAPPRDRAPTQSAGAP